jgi:hypothetical protein
MAMVREAQRWLEANNTADLSTILSDNGFIDLPSICTITDRYSQASIERAGGDSQGLHHY